MRTRDNEPGMAGNRGHTLRRLHRTRRCASGLAATALALAALAGCGSDEPARAQTPPATTTTAAPIKAETGDPVRDAIISAMAGVSSTVVGLAADPATTITAVPAAALKGWNLYDLVASSTEQPMRVYVAVANDGRCVLLSNAPGNFATISTGGSVTSPDAAVELAQAFILTTRDPSRLAYPVSSVDELRWLPQPNADQMALKDHVVANYGSLIKAPVAALVDGQNYEVNTWWVEAEELVLHTISVSADGTTSDTRSVEQSSLPVVIGR